MIALPAGLLPVKDLSTEEILYGSRTTSFRFELLAHDSATGVDSLAGYLDGVEPDGSLRGEASQPVKWGGTLRVRDVEAAGVDAAGNRLTRMADVDLTKVRIRPVRTIEGLGDTPLGVYLLNASPESWSGTGRTYDLVLHDKATVLDQDRVEETFTASSDEPILQIVAAVIASAGETIAVDGSDTRTLATPLVWEAGTSKLQIVNDLLTGPLGYFALSVDGAGNFRASPYVAPADRSTRYSMLNDAEGNRLRRELKDGAQSIYSPEWTRDRVSYNVPNKVIAVAAGSGDGPALIGIATNENPDSPYSYQKRGNRWIVAEPLRVEVPDMTAEADPAAATVAFLEAAALRSLIARSSVQAAIEVECLPIPVDLLEALTFENTPAGVSARHTVRSMTVPFTFDGLIGLSLQEVTAL